MITHALARNIIVPFFMALFIVHLYRPDKTQKIYGLVVLFTYLSLPLILIFMALGASPITWFISSTWRTNLSTLQYIVYITATTLVLYLKTKDQGLSWTLAFISATSAGYLYEIPYWIRRGGILEIIRTAKTSFLLFDFGMLAFIYLIFMLKIYQIKIDKRLLLGIAAYLIYIPIYFEFHPQGFIALYQITRIPTAILLRTPAMILTHIAVTNTFPPEPKRGRLYYFHERPQQINTDKLNN